MRLVNPHSRFLGEPPGSRHASTPASAVGAAASARWPPRLAAEMRLSQRPRLKARDSMGSPAPAEPEPQSLYVAVVLHKVILLVRVGCPDRVHRGRLRCPIPLGEELCTCGRGSPGSGERGRAASLPSRRPGCPWPALGLAGARVPAPMRSVVGSPCGSAGTVGRAPAQQSSASRSRPASWSWSISRRRSSGCATRAAPSMTAGSTILVMAGASCCAPGGRSLIGSSGSPGPRSR